MRQLTEKQTRFVDYYVSERKTQTEAARSAGYPLPRQSAWRLLQSPRILEAIHQERQKVYQTDLTNLAVGALKQILIDKDAPTAARVSAARTVLELAGDIGPNSGNGSEGGSLCEMTPGELSRLIERWEDERTSMTKDITPA
tara:strand:- start:166 stop:591 length:426 start_codon:yes stop_codon:yes gene_type:complete